MQINLIIGFVAMILVQLLKISPIPVINEGNVKTIRAVIVLVGVAVAIAEAAMRPGGLAELDWNHVLTMAYDAGVVIFAAFGSYNLLPSKSS